MYKAGEIAEILMTLNLGNSVAEHDQLLSSARVETSAFSDLYLDRVDLIPGTKGSGKTALYRIFVDYFAERLVKSRRIVIAHGVEKYGDPVFHAYKSHFDKLDEDDFVAFWCIYFFSLAHTYFVKDARFSDLLAPASVQIEEYKAYYKRSGLPDLERGKSLKEIIEWVLSILKVWRPSVTYTSLDNAGEIKLTLFDGVPEGKIQSDSNDPNSELPLRYRELKVRLEDVVKTSELKLWLMLDRLDEIFPRRSDLETRALRGLLRTLRIFQSDVLRIKVFLRDDILAQITEGTEGFTALTHITARQADSLRWSEEQILTLVVKRLAADHRLIQLLDINTEKVDASREYQKEVFYKIFPATVHSGPNQSPTHRWIYNHVSDGNGIVTPRDVIDLLTRAAQWQQDEFRSDPEQAVGYMIGANAILYGLNELSLRKRETLLLQRYETLDQKGEPRINTDEHRGWADEAIRRLAQTSGTVCHASSPMRWDRVFPIRANPCSSVAT